MLQQQGLWAVHSAVLLFAVTAQFSKFIELPALDITPLRSIFAALVLMIFMIIKRQKLALDHKGHYALALLLGLLLAFHWVTYFHAMQISSIAVGVISLYTYPVITVFLEPLFHGEKPRGMDILSALAVLLGIYLMMPAFDWNNSTTQGILWGVLSALLFSLRNIIQGRYFYRYSSNQTLLYQIVVVIVLLLPWVAPRAEQVSEYQWLQLLVLGVFFTALPHSLFVHGLRFMKAKKASLIACLQVVYSAAMAAIWFNEWPAFMTWVGGTIVVLAAIYATYYRPRQLPPKIDES